MNARQMKHVMLMMCMLFFGFGARGQTITINGPDSLCKGTQGNYSLTPVTGINYTWSVTPEGTVSPATGSNVTIFWSGSGTATITVVGTNASNVVVATGTKHVVVVPAPEPVLTWNVQVGCQIADSNTERKGGDLDIEDGPCLRVCEKSHVIYTVSNALSGSTFSWQITGGNINATSGNTCTVTWNGAGQGSISVTETNSFGCSGTKSLCIEIIPGPNALFTMQPFMPDEHFVTCVNKLNQFTDLSDPGLGTPLVSWYWDFGDGGYSPLQNPTHTYLDPGSYVVTLTVTNECNCSKTYKMEVEVMPEEGLTIHCPSVVCEGQTARYTIDPWNQQLAECIENGNAYWEAEGGTITNTQSNWVDVIWNKVDSLGFGYIKFFVGDGCGVECPTPTVVKVPVIQQKGYIQGPTDICVTSKQYLYKMPQWPATVFNWSIQTTTGALLIPTDQPNEYIIQTSGTGTIDIKVAYQNTLLGCSGVATKTIKVTAPPTVVGATTVCAFSYSDYALSAGSGNWTLSGPGGYSQTASGSFMTGYFPVAGNYTLTVSGTGFCSPDPLNIEALGKPSKPDSILGPDTVCAGTPYVFTGKNAVPGTIFHWAVTGGTFSGSSSGSNVSISFPPGGPYTVKVWREIVQSPYCSSDTLYHTVYPPHVVVTVSGDDTACGSTYHDYTAGYQNGETYEWRIYPSTLGTVSTPTPGADVQVLWNQVTTGQYADLVVKVRKCSVDYIDTLKVWVRPSVDITIVAPDTVCRGYGFSASLNPTLTSYSAVSWNMGDGTTYNTLGVGHQYTTLNQGNTIYTISVVVNDPDGCYVPAAATHDITVMPSPVANVTPPGPFKLCDTINGLPISLIATMQSGFGATSGIDWYRSGNVVSTGGASNTGYSANILGEYYAIVTNTNGCSAMTNKVNIVYFCGNAGCVLSPMPTVTATGGLTDCGTVTLSGTYSAGGFNAGWIYPWQATPVTLGPNNAEFTFKDAGNYQFIYSVSYINSQGDTCNAYDTVGVIVPFIAGLKYHITCGSVPGKYEVSLIDHSNYYPPNIMTNWSFYINNFTTPVQSGTTASYTTNLAPGTYVVAMEIHNNNSADLSCWVYDTLTLPSLPVASFSYSPNALPTCRDYPVSFTSLSTPAPLKHLWDFGDLSYNSQVDPEKVYVNPGFYPVKLVVTDTFGCVDDTTIAVVIQPNQLDGDIIAAPTAPCEGEAVNLSYSNSGISIPNGYYWVKETDTFATTTVDHFFVHDPGSYWVSVSDPYFCSFSTGSKVVDYTFVPDAEITGDTNVCLNSDFSLYGYAGPDITMYQWFRNGVSVASGNIPTLQQSGLAAGTSQYQLVIKVPKSGGGYCTDTSDIFVLHVNNPPPAPSISYSMASCDMYQVDLSASNSVSGTYTWSNGMSGTPISVYSGGPYKVYFHDGSGCITTAETDVPKDPELYLWIFPKGCYKLCRELLDNGHYVLNGPVIPFYYWEWANSYYSESGSGNVDPYTVMVDGPHTLTLDNQLCKRTSEVMDVEAVDCRCEIDVTEDGAWIEWSSDGGCHIYMKINISNPYGNNIAVSLSSPDGYFIPSTLTVPPGGGTFTVEFVPNTGFPGGGTMLYASSNIVTEDGIRPCYSESPIEVPEGCHTKRREADGGNRTMSADGKNELILAPNPADHSTKVLYEYQNTTRSHRISVYDVTGRLVADQPVAEGKGAINLDLREFGAGVYMVVMKEDGKVLVHQRLVVTH